MKKSLIVLTLLGLYGCSDGQDKHPSTLLSTSSQDQLEVQASDYHVQVVFVANESTQDAAVKGLTARVTPFESWAKQQGLPLTGGPFEQFPRYDYRQKEGRQLMGYDARQTFHLKSLTFDQYQQVIANAPKYMPESVQMMGVEASESDRQKAQQILMNKVFEQNERKASAMAKAANLCGLTVQSIQEQSHGSVMPRMMKMEMADASSVHSTQSNQTLNLTLMVEWKAYPCD